MSATQSLLDAVVFDGYTALPPGSRHRRGLPVVQLCSRGTTIFPFLLSLSAALAAALVSNLMTRWLMPLLSRYALARPNARSSHRVPTPQGAGIAVIAATLAAAGAVVAFNFAAELGALGWIFGATVFIALVGAADDIKSIPVLPRMLLQGLAVAAVVFAASGDLRIVPAFPVWLERGMLILAGLWFVNLVNFMDGLDWMTVAEVIPVTAALVLFGILGEISLPATIVAAALAGAMLGFAPFNRPVARVFLGDVGSLPIGLLLGGLLLELIHRQHLIAAILLPLYYVADATLTLLRRSVKFEPIWAAHRSHFYQRATDNGYTVLATVSGVFVLNLVLAALAFASIVTSSWTVKFALLLAGALAVAVVLRRFSRRR